MNYEYAGESIEECLRKVGPLKVVNMVSSLPIPKYVYIQFYSLSPPPLCIFLGGVKTVTFTVAEQNKGATFICLLVVGK